MISRALAVFLVCQAAGAADDVKIAGLQSRVEVLRDRWGIPHIYAANQHDLFFAQGYITAQDRLFQIDLWRRAGTGKLAQVLGPSALARDRIARAVRFRGDWEAEWASYGPDAKQIATAFTSGINAYIRSLGRKLPAEFARAGYAPGLWAAEDCVARIAGLGMVRNITREVARATDIRNFGLETVRRELPVSPPIRIDVPEGLDLADVDASVLAGFTAATSAVRFGDAGSNNWVVDGTMTATGKPLLANDPHRLILNPSLRKTVHLVAPGWNVIGAGEPALPGVALGHNERIAFGFTIVGIDQADLYVEKINPSNPAQYRYRGAWRDFEMEHQDIPVRGQAAPASVELRYTVHGPVIHEDRARQRVYVLRWVGAEPGGAGYLAALRLARARNWSEFREGLRHYHVPSENLVYADVDGNIGWQAAGMTPIRKGWTGLLPVPGDGGKFEWSGFRNADELPSLYNPPRHYIATANHNILPDGYPHALGYEWAPLFRFHRIREMLEQGRKFTVADFARMQQDVFSLPARRLQAVVRKWRSRPAAAEQFLAWDARLDDRSGAALLYEVWISLLPAELFGPELGPRVELEHLLTKLETGDYSAKLASSLEKALTAIRPQFGADPAKWRWSELHTVDFAHPLNVAEWRRGPIGRPGDAHTVNATSGTRFRQTGGASFRQIIDLSDWDKSIMTNVPGESGDPGSRHYSDLVEEWAAGRYHPMTYSRKAVEAAVVERINLVPAR